MSNLLNKAIILSLCLMVTFVSCDKDDEDVAINFENKSLFFTEFSQTETVSFSTENISTVEVVSKPNGWTVEADFAKRTLTITSPEVSPTTEEEEEGISLSGNITVRGTSVSKDTDVATMFVAIAGDIDLSSTRSNSYIVSDKVTNYHFDATKRGETTETLNIARAGILWQSSNGLLDNLVFADGKISFFVDKDEEEELVEGNALIGAYDANGDVIWSWHIWVVEKATAEKTITVGGKTFMSVNLGAFMSANESEEDILASYGLYYQWGRKDPFVGPLKYNAAGADNASMYSGKGDAVSVIYAESTGVIGTQNYAVAHPLTFILGLSETKNDWLYSEHLTTLWSEVKSINDPCPKGWRVPSNSELAPLQIKDENEGTEGSFGWDLTDGTTSSFFVGAGRRVYTTGHIQNIYIPRSVSAQPWEGMYWTLDSESEAKSSALFFFYNTDYNVDTENLLPRGGIESVAHYRANGMQIRCVKI